MAIFIGHKTALAYWRTHDRNWAQPISQATPQENNSPCYAQMDTGILWKFGIDKEPVSILVSHERNRRRSQGISPRIWSGKHPSRSFYKIARNLYISTPEATFLQLGNELSLIQLIAIGYELCGSYGLSAQSSSGFLRRDPRSDTFHSDASKLHLDSSRRSTLEKAGVHVVSVTKNQVFDRGKLLGLAAIASKKLGKRLSSAPFDFTQKQDEIYQAAFK